MKDINTKLQDFVNARWWFVPFIIFLGIDMTGWALLVFVIFYYKDQPV